MSTEKKTQVVNFNPQGVIAPLLKILEECTNVVLFGLQTIETVKEIPPDLEIEDGFFRMQIGKVETDIELKKQVYKTWLIKKGFEDLIKGINLTLMEAYLYVSLISRAADLKTGQDFNKAFSEIRKQALKMNLPDLIEKIKPHLNKDLTYERQIRSINKARTCLVHRNGILTEKDTNDIDNQLLKLEWVRFKLFYEKDGGEIEIQGKSVIEGGTTIKMKQESNFIDFKIGDRINLNYKQFNEFIVTCNYFGADLVDCLPKEIK